MYQVGNWKKFFTPEKAEEWNRWIEQKIDGTGLAEKERDPNLLWNETREQSFLYVLSYDDTK